MSSIPHDGTSDSSYLHSEDINATSVSVSADDSEDVTESSSSQMVGTVPTGGRVVRPRPPPLHTGKSMESSNSMYSSTDDSFSTAGEGSKTTTTTTTSLAEKRASFMQSAATRRALRMRGSKRRSRVKGGAAAKLVGKVSPEEEESEEPPHASFHASMEEQTVDDVKVAKSFTEVREKAKEAWTVGTEDNTRYAKNSADEDEQIESPDRRRPKPSNLSRDHNVPENATSSVSQLLAERNSDSNLGLDDGSFAGSTADMSSSRVVTSQRSQSLSPRKRIVVSVPKPSSFRNPFANKDAGSLASGVGFGSVAGGTIVAQEAGGVGLVEATSNLKRPVVVPVVSEKTEKDIEYIKNTLIEPSEQLSDLLVTICSPENRSTMDRGYMVRRKNACGALKLLSSKKQNRKKLCWTVGTLPALTSVLDDVGPYGIETAFPDIRIRNEYDEARKRTVQTLLNLAAEKENRIVMFHSPGLVQALIRTIEEDMMDARQGACAVLAFFARTPENRTLMGKVPHLLDAISAVLNPDGDRKKILFKKSLPPTITRSTDHTFPTEVGKYGSLGSNMSGGSGGEVSNLTRTFESSLGSKEDFKTESKDNNNGAKDNKEDGIAPLSPKNHSYDDDPNECLNGARQNTFALLMHLIKEKENAFVFARHEELIFTLVMVSKLQDSPSHAHAVVIMAHFTRHKENSKWIVMRLRNVVPALVTAAQSPNDGSRKFACYALQNLSQDKSCRQEVANTPELLVVVCERARKSTDHAEKLSAISILQNLTDDPGNLVPMTNTPQCFATLIRIAHGQDSDTTEEMRYLACDGLATLSHWFRKVATSAQSMEHVTDEEPKSPRSLFVPSLKVVTWNQWE